MAEFESGHPVIATYNFEVCHEARWRDIDLFKRRDGIKEVFCECPCGGQLPVTMVGTCHSKAD